MLLTTFVVQKYHYFISIIHLSHLGYNCLANSIRYICILSAFLNQILYYISQSILIELYVKLDTIIH